MDRPAYGSWLDDVVQTLHEAQAIELLAVTHCTATFPATGAAPSPALPRRFVPRSGPAPAHRPTDEPTPPIKAVLP